MCSICDGATEDEVMARLAAAIDERGWAVQGVEASPANWGWHYTIGLLETYHHPELVVASGLDPEAEAALLHHLVTVVESGGSIRPDQRIGVLGTEVTFAPVHPRQFQHGVFTMRLERYRAFPELLERLSALQVVLPSRFFCEHTERQPRLDRPEEALTRRTANRRARREKTRADGRRRPPNRRR